MPILNSCCSRIPLQRGTVTIGGISLFGAIVYLITFCIAFKHRGYDEFDDKLDYAFTGKVKIVIAACIISCVISFLVILGALRRDKRLLLPYLVTVPLGMLATLVNLIYTLLILPNAGDNTPSYMVIRVSSYFGCLAINLYGMLVVLSYYQILSSEKLQTYRLPNDYVPPSVITWSNIDPQLVINNQYYCATNTNTTTEAPATEEKA